MGDTILSVDYKATDIDNEFIKSHSRYLFPDTMINKNFTSWGKKKDIPFP